MIRRVLGALAAIVAAALLAGCDATGGDAGQGCPNYPSYGHQCDTSGYPYGVPIPGDPSSGGAGRGTGLSPGSSGSSPLGPGGG